MIYAVGMIDHNLASYCSVKLENSAYQQLPHSVWEIYILRMSEQQIFLYAVCTFTQAINMKGYYLFFVVYPTYMITFTTFDVCLSVIDNEQPGGMS